MITATSEPESVLPVIILTRSGRGRLKGEPAASPGPSEAQAELGPQSDPTGPGASGPSSREPHRG